MGQAELVALQRVIVDEFPGDFGRPDQPSVGTIPIRVHEAEALCRVGAKRLTVALDLKKSPKCPISLLDREMCGGAGEEDSSEIAVALRC